jgi:hypothetical protein
VGVPGREGKKFLLQKEKVKNFFYIPTLISSYGRLSTTNKHPRLSRSRKKVIICKKKEVFIVGHYIHHQIPAMPPMPPMLEPIYM